MAFSANFRKNPNLTDFTQTHCISKKYLVSVSLLTKTGFFSMGLFVCRSRRQKLEAFSDTWSISILVVGAKLLKS